MINSALHIIKWYFHILSTFEYIPTKSTVSMLASPIPFPLNDIQLSVKTD